MHVGVLLIFQNYEKASPDEEIVWNNVKLGEAADRLGYDSLWSVEHHFDADYSMCPDNIVVLANLAARTKNIALGSGAVILPWNDPLRVAEKVAMLDVLSEGRFIFGMGRGLARVEFEGMRIPMDESRERFDEAAEMIVEALETGVAEYDGKHYKQPRVEIHPRPLSTFRGRTYAVAMSPDSAQAAARLKVGMMSFVQGDVETVHLPLIELYRETYRELHGEEAPPPLLSDLVYCHRDAGYAAEVAHKYTGAYFRTCVTHYELFGQHFSDTAGYASYGEAAEMLSQAGLEGACHGYVEAQNYGTPEQMLEKYKARLELVGEFGAQFVPYHGGMPFELAQESFELMSAEVLPELRKLGAPAGTVA